MKKHAPATLRNREAIAAVLAKELPTSGVVLEIASGSGEHAVYFAERFAQLDWQPSDTVRDAIGSILAYRAEYAGFNMRLPLVLDASAPGTWEMRSAAAILCSNMAHIAPWDATTGLFEGAAQILGGPEKGAPLIFYGPFIEQGVENAPSNIEFDQSLRARDPQWGIRSLEDMDGAAAAHGFSRSARHAMPANNLVLVYRAA